MSERCKQTKTNGEQCRASLIKNGTSRGAAMVLTQMMQCVLLCVIAQHEDAHVRPRRIGLLRDVSGDGDKGTTALRLAIDGCGIIADVALIVLELSGLRLPVIDLGDRATKFRRSPRTK